EIAAAADGAALDAEVAGAIGGGGRRHRGGGGDLARDLGAAAAVADGGADERGVQLLHLAVEGRGSDAHAAALVDGGELAGGAVGDLVPHHRGLGIGAAADGVDVDAEVVGVLGDLLVVVAVGVVGVRRRVADEVDLLERRLIGGPRGLVDGVVERLGDVLGRVAAAARLE